MKKLISISLLYFFPLILSAQTKNTGTVVFKGMFSVKDLQKLSAKSGKFTSANVTEEEEEESKENLEKELNLEKLKTNGTKSFNEKIINTDANLKNGNSQIIESITFCNDFLGSSNNSFYPPDITLAVGYDHLISATNSEVSIFLKNGTVATPAVSLNTFWAPLGSTDIFDPKLLYDQNANRYIFVIALNRSSASSAIGLAVSVSSDPLGGWYFYYFDADPANNLWFDYPSVGFSGDKIVVSGNMFPIPGGGGTSTNTYVIDKAGAYNATLGSTFIFFTLNNFRPMHPAVTFDNTNTDYVLQTSVGSGNYSLYYVNGAASSPTMDYLGEVNFAALPYFSQGFTAPQSGVADRIDLGDARMLSCILRGGNIYFSHNIQLPNNGPATQAGFDIGYFNAATLNPVGKTRWSGSTSLYSYPNIAVNAAGEISGGLSAFSTTTHPSMGAVYWNPGTPGSDFATSLFSGVNTYAHYDPSGRNRWGDYSGAAVDPTDDMNMWIAGEYSSATINEFSSRIYKLCSPCDSYKNITTTFLDNSLKKIAASTIETSSTITGSSTRIKFQAQNVVVLKPGFVAVSGTNVKVYIAACDAEIPF